MVRIFIAHSSKDGWLINTIANNLKLIPTEPYLARLEDPTPYPLPQKIDSAINSSVAMFAFLTPNVANNKDTRDVVNWEISAAYAKKKPIYVFAEKGVEVPFMVNYVTVYATYDPFDQETLNKMSARVQEIATKFKQDEDSANAVNAAVVVVLILLGFVLFFGALSSSGKR
jgi:Flp pilus assembly pilin Flp